MHTAVGFFGRVPLSFSIFINMYSAYDTQTNFTSSTVRFAPVLAVIPFTKKMIIVLQISRLFPG